MHFLVKNHSARMHSLDRDIAPKASETYSEEQMAKVFKALANAMGTMAFAHLTNANNESYVKGMPAERSELEVVAVDGERRTSLTADELRVIGAKLNPAPAAAPSAEDVETLKAQLAEARKEAADHKAVSEELLAMVDAKTAEKTAAK